MQNTMILRKNSKKCVLFLLTFLTLLNVLPAQTEFPSGNYWSFDAGVGMTGLLVEGRSYQAVIDPKIWLSPLLMIGNKFSVNYSTDEILSFEGQAYLRLNFLRLGKANKKVNFFLQGGMGVLASYRGSPDNPFSDVTKTRGSLLADAAMGITIPITSRWHIEPSIHGGYPHIAGVSITTGVKFPFRAKHKSQNDIINQLSIAFIDFIMFGPDTEKYNIGIDRDAQGLNEMVLNHIAEMLKEHPDYRVRIEGHANPVTNVPAKAANLMDLSKLRAKTIARQLNLKGVEDEQIVTAAFGGTKTLTKDFNIRNRNRRVELIVIQVNDE